MPVKEIEKIIIEFKYNDKDYILDKYRIYDDSGDYICSCDLTGTVFYGNYDQMRFLAKLCLHAFYHGKAVGEEKGRKEIQDKMKDALGIF